jgi:hypothetical protein
MVPSNLRPRLWTAPRRDRYEVGVRSGDVALTILVVPPGHDYPVGLEAQTVIRAPRDRNEVRVRRGHIALVAIAIESPGHDHPVGLETQAVTPARCDRHEILQRRGFYDDQRAPSDDEVGRLATPNSGPQDQNAQADH